jgi:hypothetical protein
MEDHNKYREIHHLGVNIQGLLNNYKGKTLKGLLQDDEGNLLTDSEARTFLKECQDKGWKLLPSADCEGFDPLGGGCPGHRVKDEIVMGKKFTSKWFKGVCEIISIDAFKNILVIEITTETSSRTEEWNLSHTKIGFKNGDYVEALNSKQ